MKRIIWRKWQDPLAPLVKGKQAKGYEPEEDDDDPQFQAARLGWSDENDDPVRGAGGETGSGPAVIGPIGIVPLHESNLPSRLFNFWMGDTNFDIDEAAQAAIEAVPGVESLDVFTRYRFRVGVGRAFNAKEVLHAVTLAVCPPPAPEPGSGLDTLISLLKSKFAHWAAFVLPGGRFEYAGGQTVEEVKLKGKRYADKAERTITSWGGQ